MKKFVGGFFRHWVWLGPCRSQLPSTFALHSAVSSSGVRSYALFADTGADFLGQDDDAFVGGPFLGGGGRDSFFGRGSHVDRTAVDCGVGLLIGSEYGIFA